MTGRHRSGVEARLFLVGNVPLDLTQRVPRLPLPGEDLRSDHRQVRSVGGGFHVLNAAWRSGLRGRFAGAHGSGPFGDQVRGALADIECEVVRPVELERDTAVVVVLVTPTGERTFVSPPESVPAFTTAVLESLQPGEADLVYVSGYSLGLGSSSAPLAAWVSELPRRLPVFCDLGPWGATATAESLAPVLRRVDWLACNAREAEIVTGQSDPGTAVVALKRRTSAAGVLVRVGEDGCWLAEPGASPTLVPVPVPVLDPVPDPAPERDLGATPEPAVDSTGAGDAHSGAFLAALAAGWSPPDAVGHANGVAHRVVTRAGDAFGSQGFGSELAGED